MYEKEEHSIPKEVQILAMFWNKSTHSLKDWDMLLYKELRIRLLSLYISWEKPFSLRLAAKFQNERMLWCWIKFDMCHSFGENGIHQNYGFCIDPSHHFPPHLSCSSYESHDTGEVYFSFLATSCSYFFPFILSWLWELKYQEEDVKVQFSFVSD